MIQVSILKAIFSEITFYINCVYKLTYPIFVIQFGYKLLFNIHVLIYTYTTVCDW